MMFVFIQPLDLMVYNVLMSSVLSGPVSTGKFLSLEMLHLRSSTDDIL